MALRETDVKFLGPWRPWSYKEYGLNEQCHRTKDRSQGIQDVGAVPNQ